jgi:ATP-dependent DNA helicase RecG
MTRTELLELLANGESSSVEFKRDEVANYDFAKELVAFANFVGGVVLLGVEDDGSIHGTTRESLEEWVMEACRTKIEPPVIPYFSWYRNFEPGKDIAVVRVLGGPDKPYARIHQNRRTYFVRVGSTSREASAAELERMFQASGRLTYGLKPVPGAGYPDLDGHRLADYLSRILSSEPPHDGDTAGWTEVLTNLDLMIRDDEIVTPTVDGLLLFGRNPKRYLPQSGVRALAYPGTSPDYATRADQELRGPLVPLADREGGIVESGLVEQALDFINRNTQPAAELSGGVRIDRPAYPADVLREVVVNALVHRDYSIVGTDVQIALFDDRLEVTSPGRLPNTATIDGLLAGFRYARNQTLVNVMRDYGYVDFRGMGIRTKVIPGMQNHNATEPDFIETDHAFAVRLWLR